MAVRVYMKYNGSYSTSHCHRCQASAAYSVFGWWSIVLKTSKWLKTITTTTNPNGMQSTIDVYIAHVIVKKQKKKKISYSSFSPTLCLCLLSTNKQDKNAIGREATCQRRTRESRTIFLGKQHRREFNFIFLVVAIFAVVVMGQVPCIVYCLLQCVSPVTPLFHSSTMTFCVNTSYTDNECMHNVQTNG